jgi:cysteine synthase A
MLINSALDTVGDVPLIRLSKLSSGNVFAKAEFLNPGGSIKDRVAKHIIETAERRGALQPGKTIIEATSGNTGIGLTLVGVLKGYRVLCVMPGNVSEERKKIIRRLAGRSNSHQPRQAYAAAWRECRKLSGPIWIDTL